MIRVLDKISYLEVNANSTIVAGQITGETGNSLQIKFIRKNNCSWIPKIEIKSSYDNKNFSTQFFEISDWVLIQEGLLI